MMGGERPPTLRDRGAMPYTEAFLHEAQRFLDLVPLGFIRTVKRDTRLGGFTVPDVPLVGRGSFLAGRSPSTGAYGRLRIARGARPSLLVNAVDWKALLTA